VRAEMDAGKRVYLEDELGDIFWVFICLLEWLEQEWKIEKQRIFERCYQKFSERIGNDGLWVADWDEVKKLQKERLKQEQESLKL
jgi:NTP pyrophosphatase (non-canonical NTP hydrolase)